MGKEVKRIQFNPNPEPFIIKSDPKRLALRRAKERLVLELSEVMRVPISQAEVIIRVSDFTRQKHKYSVYRELLAESTSNA